MTAIRRLRSRLYDFLEMGSFGSWVGTVFEVFMIILIVSNVIAVAAETVPELWERYHYQFQLFEIFSVSIFTVEYIVRLWVSVEKNDPEDSRSPTAHRIAYIFSPMAIIDLLAILPFHLLAATGIDLRFLRIFRLLKFLKLVRYSAAMSSLIRVIYEERRALHAALIIMIGLLFFAASLMYLAERHVQPEDFGSIPAALWWAIATLTTVGYGDVVPITTEGKIIGGFVMVFGLAFFAIPIGIIASGFSSEMHRKEFIVPTGAIRAFPVFNDIPPTILADIARRIQTIQVNAGTVVTHRRDQENGLYVIISGEMSAYYHQRPIALTSGDFFGEASLIVEQGQQPAIVARNKCRLLRLETQDLHMLISIYPEFGNSLYKIAQERLTELVDEGMLRVSDMDTMISILKMWVPPKP